MWTARPPSAHIHIRRQGGTASQRAAIARHNACQTSHSRRPLSWPATAGAGQGGSASTCWPACCDRAAVRCGGACPVLCCACSVLHRLHYCYLPLALRCSGDHSRCRRGAWALCILFRPRATSNGRNIRSICLSIARRQHHTCSLRLIASSSASSLAPTHSMAHPRPAEVAVSAAMTASRPTRPDQASRHSGHLASRLPHQRSSSAGRRNYCPCRCPSSPSRPTPAHLLLPPRHAFPICSIAFNDTESLAPFRKGKCCSARE